MSVACGRVREGDVTQSMLTGIAAQERLCVHCAVIGGPSGGSELDDEANHLRPRAPGNLGQVALEHHSKFHPGGKDDRKAHIRAMNS